MNLLILKADAASRYAADDYKTVAVLSNDSTHSCPFYDDLRTEKLEDFYDTYQFSVPANEEESQHIVRGNYVVFQDETYKYRLFRIYDVEDALLGDIHVKTAYAENAFVHDLLKTLVPRAKVGTVNFRDAFAHCLSNSGWQIKNAEWLGELIAQEFDGTTTAQAEIQTICKDYRGEIDAYVELNDANKIINKCFDLVEERGRHDTGKRFEYRRDLVGVTRRASDAELYTAIKARGKDGITFTDMNNGSDTIYDSAANDLYNGGREYLVKFVEYSELETPSALYSAARQELNECNRPKYQYEIDTALLNQMAGYTDEEPVWLGDSVRAVDFEMAPELTVGARIIEKETSFSDPTKNKVVLGEYVELVNNTPDEIKKLQSDLTTLNNSLSPVYRIEIRPSAGLIARNGYLQTTGDAVLEAVVYKDNIRVNGTKEQYVWEKIYRKTGEHDTAWEMAQQNIGNTVTVTGEDYAKNCDFYCHFLDDSFNFVATTYFKTAIEDMVKKIEALQNTHVIIPFITDTHYATDGMEYTQSKLRSMDHIRNVVEITHQVDCDLVVHGGDLVDGKTSKALTLSNLQAVTAMLNQSDCPVMFTKGNHDDNGLGDVRQYGAKGDGLVKPKEMAMILKNQYLQHDITYNDADNAIYSYYDVEDKKLRVLVLDAWDLRYDLLDDVKKVKYQSRKYLGFQATQIQYVADVLKQTPSDYGVAVFVHNGLNGTVELGDWTAINDEVISGVFNAWRTGTAYDSTKDALHTANKNSDYPVTIKVDYSERGPGKLISFFAGHKHRDSAKRNGFGNTPTILTNCSYSAGDADDKERRIIGTVNEDLFDVIAISVDLNDIQLIRFGAQFNNRPIRQYVGGA